MGVVFAVFKHALYDGPAHARGSAIGEAFEKRCEDQSILSKRLPPYLTWRCCYLLCAVLFGVARIALGFPPPDLNEKYSKFLNQLPPSVPADRFDNLVSFLTNMDLLLWLVGVVAYLPVVASAVLALPSKALQRAVATRRMLWAGWLLAFIPPFLLLLVFPIRSMVDWGALVEDVCDHSIKRTMMLPGTEIKSALEYLYDKQLLKGNLKALGEGNDVFCKQEGVQWRETFYNKTVNCVWYFEDACRITLCPTLQIEQAFQCFVNCVPFAVKMDAKGVAESFEKIFIQCTEASSDKMPKFRTNRLSGTAKQTADMLYPLIQLQREAVENIAEVSTQSTLQSEYVVGLLIGVVVGKHLLAAAISLLSGLGEASMQAKAILPALDLSGWLLILITAQAVPIYAALLAIFQQILGDYYLAGTFICIVLFLSLGILTGVHITHCTPDPLQEFHTPWFDYAARITLAVGVVAFLAVWSVSKDVDLINVQGYIQDTLLTPDVLIFVITDFLYRKIVTATAGTDFVLHAFVQAESWRQAVAPEGKEEHSLSVNDLRCLWQNNSKKKGGDPDQS